MLRFKLVSSEVGGARRGGAPRGAGATAVKGESKAQRQSRTARAIRAGAPAFARVGGAGGAIRGAG